MGVSTIFELVASGNVIKDITPDALDMQLAWLKGKLSEQNVTIDDAFVLAGASMVSDNDLAFLGGIIPYDERQEPLTAIRGVSAMGAVFLIIGEFLLLKAFGYPHLLNDIIPMFTANVNDQQFFSEAIVAGAELFGIAVAEQAWERHGIYATRQIKDPVARDAFFIRCIARAIAAKPDLFMFDHDAQGYWDKISKALAKILISNEPLHLNRDE